MDGTEQEDKADVSTLLICNQYLTHLFPRQNMDVEGLKNLFVPALSVWCTVLALLYCVLASLVLGKQRY